MLVLLHGPYRLIFLTSFNNVMAIVIVYMQSYRYLSLRLHLPVFEIALPEGVCTRTTLFTTVFTMIILVYSLKFMCIPSFTSIGWCFSELYAHH